MNSAFALAAQTALVTVGLTVAALAATSTPAAADWTSNGDLVLTTNDACGAAVSAADALPMADGIDRISFEMANFDLAT